MIRQLRLHVRRLGVLLLDALFDHNCLYTLLGWMQRRWGWPRIQTVFLMYPETRAYALAFVYPRRLQRVKWTPFLAGIFRQNQRWGLMFAISATQQDFRDAQNLPQLRKLVERMETIRRRVGARQKTFAGILPGVLFARRILREAPEADLTVSAVIQAIQQVEKKEALPHQVPILVLGGRGFIGRRLVRALQSNGRMVFAVDKNEPWPVFSDDNHCVVVNVASNRALLEYMQHLQPGMVIINEAYPPPPSALLQHTGIVLYHIKGIRAWALPPFPHAYRGGIPCCAAFPDNRMDVLVEILLYGSRHMMPKGSNVNTHHHKVET